uniref:E3 ubiquitin-protein ligase n=1 Tax=Globodera pallida TaxID=36090 RepID=A0A183BT63_GLOPA
MVQHMFDALPAMHIAVPGTLVPTALSLHALGRAAEIVLDSSDDVTVTVPTTEGNALPNAILRSDFASNEGRGWADREIMQEKKERKKRCYVALDFVQCGCGSQWGPRISCTRLEVAHHVTPLRRLQQLLEVLWYDGGGKQVWRNALDFLRLILLAYPAEEKIFA